MQTLVHMPSRALIAITGKDARSFLNGIVTANIAALQPGKACQAALLTPQGKIIVEFLICDASDDEPLFLIDCSVGYADDLIDRLQAYRLRADVSLSRVPQETGISVLLDAPALAGEAIYAFADPRHPTLGQRLYGPMEAIRAEAGAEDADIKTYHARRIALGIPELGMDYAPLQAFPHEVLMDLTGGVDFKKGCYIGQEVVSRMEHRGTARTRALPIRFLNGFGISGGEAVMAGEISIGQAGECIDDRTIALIRIDRLKDALSQGREITAGGVPLVVEAGAFDIINNHHKT